jgi:hypothetical protein
VVTRYRIFLENRQLAAGTINGRLAAVRRLAYEAADAGLLSPELAAGIRRVKGAKKLGVRLGNWLTAEEARRFWQAPASNTLKGKRDRAILAVLLGCGLRRRELADLDFTHLQQREEHWAIVDLVGKGGHIRTVPVPEWVKATIDLWVVTAGITAGRLFRCVCRAGKHWGDGVTERVVWHVMKQYARTLGLPQVAPHDSEAFVREAVPCIGWRIGSDPIPSRARLRPDNRALSRVQTADSRSCERPDRHRTLAAAPVHRSGSPTTRPTGLLPSGRQLVQNVFSAFRNPFRAPLPPIASATWLIRLRTHSSDQGVY